MVRPTSGEPPRHLRYLLLVLGIHIVALVGYAGYTHTHAPGTPPHEH